MPVMPRRSFASTEPESSPRSAVSAVPEVSGVAGVCASPEGGRLRLSPQERIPQILQAAAQEFARQGYQQTRVQDIAAAAGLSKGGFYAHFSGKEAVFEALLRHNLSGSSINLQDAFSELPPMPQLIDELSEMLTQGLTDQQTMLVFRILLADGWRVPEVVDSWLEHSIHNVQAELGLLLKRCVANGSCRSSIVVEKPWLVLSPVVHSMVARLVNARAEGFDRDLVRQDLSCLLKELLLLRGDAS